MSETTEPADKPKRRARKPGDTLTSEQRKKLLKPRTNYEELIDKAVSAWLGVSGQLKVTGLTPRRLDALVRKARYQQGRETRDVVAADLKIARAMDRRLFADSLAYRGLLDVHAAAKAAGRRSQAVTAAFRFLAEALGAK